jgi:O-antigen/teichoic acid export membrane protein
MTDQGPDAGVHSTARRVARNTFVRATAELIGKLASLGLMTVLSRKTGAGGLGVLVFAAAWSEITVTPIDMGFDRYFLRLVARDNSELDRYFFSVVSLKLKRAAPVLAISWGLLWVIGYPGQTRLAALLMTISYLLDGLSLTIFSAFNGVERGDLIGATLATQRIACAAAGIAVLLLGHGVVLVAVVYIGASALALALASVLLARKVGLPARIRPLAARRELRRRSVAFAGQELLSSGIAKLDAVLLSLFTSSVILGYYGAAYRLLEAALFIPVALQGAYSAMYTYLDERSSPTIRAAFQRSIKMLLVLLAPATVALVTVPGSLLKLLFGAGFGASVTPLRLLALTIVPLGLVLMSSSLISSRLNPRQLVIYFAIALLLNIAINLALIPPLGATGAAIAMLATESLLAALMLRSSLREVRGVDVIETAAAPVLAAVAMAGALVALHGLLWIALPVAVAVYVGVLLVSERRFAPADYAFIVDAVRRRLRPRLVAPAP